MHSAFASIHPITRQLPILGTVFFAFLTIGFAMPILPLHVHTDLGFGAFVVGLVAGSQFTAAVISRVAAGRRSDTYGSKNAVVIGLVCCAVAGAIYLVSLQFKDTPPVSLGILLIGRAVLGVGESFVFIGAQSWGLALAETAHTWRVLSWMGAAMYCAFAVGAPLGTLLYDTHGFAAIAVATTLLPLVTLIIVTRTPASRAIGHTRESVFSVVGSIWLPGLGLALSSVGLGTMTAFGSLLLAARGWTVWLAFTAFAIAFTMPRFVLGHLSDRWGGARVALIAALIEVAGQALLSASPWYGVAVLGAVLRGLGYSMVYPAFGVEALKRAPAQSRGLAMGAYTAFLDVTLGVGSPALGLVGARAGIQAVFLVGAIIVAGAAVVAACLLLPSRGSGGVEVAGRSPDVLSKASRVPSETPHVAERAIATVLA